MPGRPIGTSGNRSSGCAALGIGGGGRHRGTRVIGNGWISPRPVASSEIDALLQGRALASAGMQYRANR